MYEHVIQAVMAMPWAILPGKLAVIRELLAIRAEGHRLTPDEVRSQLEAARAGERVTFAGGSGVAVIPIVGTIIPRGNMLMESSGGTSVQGVARQFRAAMADPDIGRVILDVDSPGGQVGGVEELAREIYQARGQKPVTAIANGLAASAAYWIATAADEFVVTPSGQVGSIGVFGMHQDVSAALEKDGVKVTMVSAGKYKTEGNPFEPLTDEARAAMQGMIDEYYSLFVDAVARNRGVDAAAVRGGFGEGRVVTAQAAVRLGMADRVATFDEVVSGMLARPRGGQKAARADDFRARRLRAMSL